MNDKGIHCRTRKPFSDGLGHRNGHNKKGYILSGSERAGAKNGAKKEDGDFFSVSVYPGPNQSFSITGRFKVIGSDSSLVTVNIAFIGSDVAGSFLSIISGI